MVNKPLPKRWLVELTFVASSIREAWTLFAPIWGTHKPEAISPSLTPLVFQRFLLRLTLWLFPNCSSQQAQTVPQSEKSQEQLPFFCFWMKTEQKNAKTRLNTLQLSSQSFAIFASFCKIIFISLSSSDKAPRDTHKPEAISPSLTPLVFQRFLLRLTLWLSPNCSSQQAQTVPQSEKSQNSSRFFVFG